MKLLFKRKRHSLSARLVILFVFMAILFLVFVGGSLRFVFQHNFKESIRPHLFQYMEYFQKDIGFPPDFDRAKEIVNKLPVEIHLFNREKQWSSTGVPLDLQKIKYRRRFAEKGVEYALGEFEGQEYLVRKEQDNILAFSVLNSRRSWTWRKGIPLGISLILLVVLYHATRRIFSPIQVIKDGIEKIGEGDLQHRILINRNDELGGLSTSINKMTDDIQQMLEAKRHLLLAISHELRSPLTRAKVSLELINNEKQRKAINHDLSEMDNLIAELLETERLSTRHRVLNKANASLTNLVQEVVEGFFKGQPLLIEQSDSEILANIDSVRIKLLLKNLLDNALRHNLKDACPPKLTLIKVGSEVTITVQDFGKGIEEKHIPFLTEPFYRVDPARQRQTGGYGLGLYLCRIIAEAHGGSLNISSEDQKGTVVKVNLPVREDT